ncbi:MAG TPA: hypothetical protein VID27_22375 [Blastocatellia bacterium]|jgi:Spy/CpxP family protein refolding chaperone
MDAKNPNQKKAILIVIAIFVIGLAAGALAMNLYERTHQGSRRDRDRVITDMSNRLDLTSEQQTQIKAIVEETFGKYREIRRQMDEDPEVKKYMPRFDEARLQGRDKMRAVLKPEQLPEFENMVKEFDEQRQQREQHEKRGK